MCTLRLTDFKFMLTDESFFCKNTFTNDPVFKLSNVFDFAHYINIF